MICKQFHQFLYQQNEQSPLTSTHWTRQWNSMYGGNPGSGLGQAQKCGRIKPVNVIPTLPFFITRSLMAIQI